MTSRTSPYSPGSEELTLRQNGRGSRRSARSSRIRMPCESCERDSGESRDGPISAIFRQMTLGGELASTARPSSPGDSHASRSPAPGSDEARRMTVTSGRRCLESCGSSGQIGCLERMLLESSIWNSNLVVLTWKVKVIGSGRSLFQLVGSVPCTEGNGCSLLPTPDTMPEAPNQNCNRIYPKNLLQAAKDNYTPKLWPTPTAPGSHQVGKIEERGGSGNPMRMLPTPKNRDFKSGTGATIRPDHAPPLTDVIGGTLNPPWVEWLMGFPIGWTDCDVSGTPWSRSRYIRSLRVSHRLRKRK